MSNTNIRVSVININKSTLENTAISNGSVYFVEDTKELFYDFGSKRVEVKDILVLEKESERTSILFTPLNKFYFVLETQILWLYKDGAWYQISSDLTNYYNKSELELLLNDKQDKLEFTIPLQNGGLKTSTTNISYDGNGKAYLNDVAYYATIRECLPIEPIANYEIRSSFYDNTYTNNNCEFHFYKLKGYTDKYPILNLDGYNAILHNFSVGDIVMADSIKPFSGDYNDVQMCFGKIEDDGTFIPKLMCMTYGWSSGARFAKITRLYEPDEANKRNQEWRASSSFYMKYINDAARMSLSYKNQNGISDIVNIRGIKFVEKDNGITVAWVRENGEVVELSDTLTFDEIDFNCVIFNGYVYDNSNVTDTGIYGFDPTKYFVANDTIDNVVSKMIDGTGESGVHLKYNKNDFEINVKNELSLNSSIFKNFATKTELDTKQTQLEDTPTIAVDVNGLNALGVLEKNTGNAVFDWIGTIEEWELGRTNGIIPDTYICFITND